MNLNSLFEVIFVMWNVTVWYHNEYIMTSDDIIRHSDGITPEW